VSDRGYFPAGESVLRRVHEERIVGLVYGQRALLLQAMHPVAFDGLLDGTAGLSAPFKRLVRTATTMEKLFFGTRAEADRITAGIARMHARVPAAGEQEHLLWILACLADSALAVHQRFIGRLAPADRERFWVDYLVLGDLFGVARASAPADFAAFRAYMRERLASAELHVTERARIIATTVAFDLPLPPLRRPALLLFNNAIVGTLPPRARAEYGLRWGRADELGLTASTAAIRAIARTLPRSMWTGPSAREYAVVARGEERRLAAGWTPPLAA
jgi:uncharacterized protein (DUF2236 family)